jgi:hypothetical protein
MNGMVAAVKIHLLSSYVRLEVLISWKGTRGRGNPRMNRFKISEIERVKIREIWAREKICETHPNPHLYQIYIMVFK